MKPILFLLVFTSLFHLFGTKGDVIFSWRFLTITWQGIRKMIFMAMRLSYLIIGSSLMTYTTTPNQLTDGIEKLLKPLERLHVPVHDFAMMMSLALRFIPILLEETNRIIQAQSARGADFDEGNLWKRMKAMVSILVPLLVSATRRAYDLANAMEARCYHGGENRTKMKPLRYHRRDRIAYGVVALYFIGVIVIGRLVPY
jgi:energy-coupling factor transport system permease protein